MSKKVKDLPEPFTSEVLRLFPSDFMTQETGLIEVYGRDWTRVFPPLASAVVFPRSTDEVSRFLKLCSQFQIAVVPSGGRTGLSGGAVAANGEVVLSLTRMNHLGPVDTLSQTVTVQAGAVTEAVHQHCAPLGLTWPVDFASKGSSQVGGNIATNAGGVKVIRYGLARDWVLGLQVVTVSGEILDLNGSLEKNNTGIDLRQLFIGSEGVLGVITEATLKLCPVLKSVDVFFFGLSSISDVIRLFHQCRKASLPITAFEFLTRNCLESVLSGRQLNNPFSQSYPVYVLLELEREKENQEMDSWLEKLFETQQVLDGTLAQSPREAKELWALREGISESLSLKGFVHKNDIAVPIRHLEAFIAELSNSPYAQSSEIFLFGHIGDGNLHINTLKPTSLDQDAFIQKCHVADEWLYQRVQNYQGSVSAEHGIGLLKKKALTYSRTTEEIALMKAIKRAFDPQGLLNPGKIFDPQ